MRPLVPAPGIGLAYARTPFARDVYRPDKPLPFGLTVSEILSTVPELPDRFWTDGIVCLNYVWQGEARIDPVPRQFWNSVRLTEKPVTVTLNMHLPLRGGGGGGGRKNTFALIASIALVAATAAISGGALGPGGLGIAGGLFGAGSTSATIAAVATTVVGGLALAALVPPPTLNAASDTPEGTTELGTASASANRLEPGGVVPRVIGTFRAFPSLAANPLVEVVGTDEVVEAVFAMAGPHSWNSIRVDGIPVASIDDVQWQTRDGFLSDTALTLVTRQSHTDAQPVELAPHDYNVANAADGRLRNQASPDLSTPKWLTFVTRRSPHEVWLTLFLPAGIGTSTEPNIGYIMPLRFRMRARGTSTWINLPEIILGAVAPRPLKIMVKFMWEDAPGGALPTPPTAIGPIYAYKTVPTQTAVPVGIGGWNANAHFSAGAGNSLYSAATVGTTSVRNVHLEEDHVAFYLGPYDDPLNPFAPISEDNAVADTFGATWEIQVRRGYVSELADFTPTNYVNASIDGGGPKVLDFFGYRTVAGVDYGGPAPGITADQISLIRNSSVWNEHPIAAPGLALLALKAKNRAISGVSALLSSYVTAWSGSTWSGTTLTSNPAAHFRYALVSSEVNADPLPEELTDNAGIVAWRARCALDGLTCNMIADGRNLDEVLKIIASCGYARPRQSELWGVIQDQDRSDEAPVQLFTPRNMAGFRYRKAFPAAEPHGLLVRYRDRTLDYEEAPELIVYDDGYSAANAERLEEISYDGLVTEDEAQRRAEFDLAQARLRSTFYEFNVDAEALVATRGDLIAVQHDVLTRAAGWARIKEKYFDETDTNIIGLLLDSKVPTRFGEDFFAILDLFTVPDVFSLAGSTGIAMRFKDGTGTALLIKSLSDPVGYTDEVEFESPFPNPGPELGEGGLVAVGPFGSEYMRGIIASIEPGADLTASLLMVDEAPDLWPHIIFASGTIHLELALSAAAGREAAASGSIAIASTLAGVETTDLFASGSIAIISTMEGDTTGSAKAFDASFDASFG